MAAPCCKDHLTLTGVDGIAFFRPWSSQACGLGYFLKFYRLSPSSAHLGNRGQRRGGQILQAIVFMGVFGSSARDRTWDISINSLNERLLICAHRLSPDHFAPCFISALVIHHLNTRPLELILGHPN
jgi:hypothetical protein